MTITAVATIGSGQHSTSSSTFATASTQVDLSSSGDVAIYIFSTDNIATADGTSNDHVSVSGGTGVWEKLGEYTNGNGAAAAGATVSLWLFRSTGSTPVGTVFTLTLSGAVVDKACRGYKFNIPGGNRLRLAQTPPIYNGVDASNGFGSAAISGLASAQYLFFRGLAKEANSSTGITVTTSYTATGTIRSRNNARAMMCCGEFRILTATGSTSNPTLAVSGDTAGIFVALEEYAPTGTYKITDSAQDRASSAGGLVADGSSMIIGDAGGTNYQAGLRFTGVAANQGDTIVKATLFHRQLDVFGPVGAPKVHAVPGPCAAWTTTSPSAASISTASADLAYTEGVSDAWRETDVAAVVQEAINDGSWTSGSALGLILRDPTAPANRSIEIYDAFGGAGNGAVLYLEVDAGGGDGVLSGAATGSGSITGQRTASSPVTAAGAGSGSATGRATAQATVSAAGTGTGAAVGRGIVSASLVASATGAGSISGASIAVSAGAISGAGQGAGAIGGASSSVSALAAPATGSSAISGRANSAATVAAAANGTGVLAGNAILPAIVSATATGIAAVTGRANAASVLSATGAGSVFISSASNTTVVGALAASGTSAASMVGRQVVAASISASAVGHAAIIGTGVRIAVITALASSSCLAIGAASVGSTVSGAGVGSGQIYGALVNASALVGAGQGLSAIDGQRLTMATLNAVAVSGGAIIAFIPATTPEERIVTVPAEQRSVEISAESRSVAIAAEARSVIIPAESRSVAVPAEERSLSLPMEVRVAA